MNFFICLNLRHLYVILQEEQYKLKQELADLAIKLNMETQKGRKQKFDMDRWVNW